MDPISFLVTCVALYGLFTRAPGLVADAIREWGHALRGEESEAAADRRRRLVAAGIDPALGGPARQFFGNWWRDFWLDLDAGRARRRTGTGTAATEPSWVDRLRDRVDDEVRARSDRWRSRNVGPQPPRGATSGASEAGGEKPSPEPPPHSTGPSGGTPDPTQSDPEREPIRVAVTVGAPARDPAGTTSAAPVAISTTATLAIEGAPNMSNSVAQQQVTGVVSGAAEARAIQREVDQAVAEFTSRLLRVRGRIQALGEQTLGNVQMSTRSRVIAVAGQAAESAAAAQAAARGCAAEVAPLMGVVAREFDRLNS